MRCAIVKRARAVLWCRTWRSPTALCTKIYCAEVICRSGVWCRDVKAAQRARMVHLARDDVGNDPLHQECASRLTDRLKDVLRGFESCLVLGGAGVQSPLWAQPCFTLSYGQARC